MRAPRARYSAPLMKESFRLSSLGDAAADPGLREYLKAANFDITDLSDGTPVQANLAHYPQTSLVLVSTPAVTITWKRDEVSRARTVMVFARRGEIVATSDAPVVRRGNTAVLVPPGTEPVQIRATHPQNELIYLSTGAQVIPPAASRLRHDVQAPALPWRRIAPLYAFVQGVCLTPPPSPDEPDLLAAATSVVVEALARTVFWDITVMEGIVPRARTFIQEQHGNSRLNASAIAEHLRIPMRTLQAAFAAEGLTVRAELRRARTETAVALMVTHPNMPQAQRAQIAGFASLSALYRALQNRHDSASDFPDVAVEEPTTESPDPQQSS